eukprot:scaffold209318_cov45-Prasinocladus_malaysianus.AAC.1
MAVAVSTGSVKANRRMIFVDEAANVTDPLDPAVRTPLPTGTQALASPTKACQIRYLRSHSISSQELAEEEADADLISLWLGISNKRGQWSCEARGRSDEDVRSADNCSRGDSVSSGVSPCIAPTLRNPRLAELNADVTPLSRQRLRLSGDSASSAIG